MIRLSRLFVLLLLCMTLLPVIVLSYVHYQGMKQYATQTLMTELGSEAYVIKERLNNEMGALTGGLRLLTGHETIIKGVSSLFYSSQVLARFESFMNRYSVVSSMYLVTRDGRVRESYGGKLRPIERNTEVKELINNLARDYEMGVLGGRVVVIEDRDLVPDGDHQALLFISTVTSLLVRNSESVQGFLIAVVPLSNLLAQTEGIPHAKSSITQIGLALPPDAPGLISQSERLAVGEKDYSPNVNLLIKVSRSSENMGAAVAEAISPFISYQLVVMAILVGVFVLFARPILRSFNALYRTIQQMESGLPIEGRASRIWEFAHTERLLIDMQGRIRQQLATLEQNNAELATLANDKDRYLQELSSLNQSLEEKVQERTNKLALILQRIEITNRFYNQLILLRQELGHGSDDDTVMSHVVKRLHACELGLPFAVIIQIGSEPKHSYRHPDYQGEIMLPLLPRITDYCYADGLYSIPFPPPFGGGWFLLQSPSLREEELKGLLLFARELGSFLENRALTNRLAFWARTDGLTGLGNRIAFEQTMGDLETSLDVEAGLFLIDVNGLKTLNDSRGHEAGDALLRAVAQRLRLCVQESSGSLYRIGGDEFVILLEGEGLACKEALQQKLQEVQFMPATLAGREHGISFSVGYADSLHTPFSLLYKMADKAMYLQKQAYYEHKRMDGEQRLEQSQESV